MLDVIRIRVVCGESSKKSWFFFVWLIFFDSGIEKKAIKMEKKIERDVLISSAVTRNGEVDMQNVLLERLFLLLTFPIIECL